MKHFVKTLLLVFLATCCPFAMHEAEADIPATPVTASTDAAKNLYAYFYNQYGRKTISSVMADVNWNNKIAEKIHAATGKYPAMNCYDFIHIYVPGQKAGNWINYNDITPVTNWANAGGIVQLMWHFNVPVNATTTPQANGSGVTCTPSETTFRAKNVFTDGSWENKWFYEQMDRVIAVVLKLQEAGIAATWRPFHEAAGNAIAKQQAGWTTSWFWWGYDGAETYKKLWKEMYSYFQQKGVKNLIWIWTTQNYNGNSKNYNQDTDWYPGDQYVDMVARDLYGYTAEQNKQEFTEIQATYPNKMVVLGECGVDVNGGNIPFANISDCWNAGAKWGHFMAWYGGSLPDNTWWNAALNNANVITRDQVNIPNTTATFEIASEAVKNMGLGWNLGNTLDANNQKYHDPSQANYWGQQGLESESCWGQQPTKADLLRMMKDAGFGAIRVPVTWYNHMDQDGNVDAAWMNRVHEIVDYVISQGLYCIINVHHDTGADGNGWVSWLKADASNYTANKARYEKLWQQIANEFRNYDQRLLFEAYNEMLDAKSSWNFAQSSTAYDAINKYAQSFVDVVRATGGNNAQRNLIVSAYGASSGSGKWSDKLQDPLKYLNIPNGESNHVIFEVHNYPSLVDNSKNNRTISDIKAEIDAWIANLNTYLVSKGTPVIIGEWGTSNVDSGEGKTDYDVRKDLMFEFCDYLIKAMKQNNIATFYWMGLTDGAARTYPAFTQPDLALKLLQAYYGDSYNPTLPDAKNFNGGEITSATVNYTDQWGELTVFDGHFDKTKYRGIKVEMEEKPASGTLSFKVYGTPAKATAITTKTPTLAFASYTNIDKVTLQWNIADKGSIKIKSAYLIKQDGTSEPCTLKVSWGCYLTDYNYATNIERSQIARINDGKIYNLNGQAVTNPTRGIYIQGGRKIIIK